MSFDLSNWGPVTVMLILFTTIVAIAGAMISILNPDTLSFAQYLDKMQEFALALAGLAIGRGLLGTHQEIRAGRAVTASRPDEPTIHP